MGTVTHGSVRASRGSRAPRVPRGYAAAGVLVLIHGTGSLFHWGTGPAGEVPGATLPWIMGDAGLALAAGLAAVACAGRAVALVRRHRRSCYRFYSWTLAGLSCLAAAIGNGLWAWYELVRGSAPPDPSAADWSFIFFGPLALAALMAAHGERIGLAARIRLLLDTVLAAGSLFG